MKINYTQISIETNNINIINSVYSSLFQERVSISIITKVRFTLDNVVAFEFDAKLFSARFLQDPSVSAIDKKVKKILEEKLTKRTHIYQNPQLYKYFDFLKENLPLSITEREHFVAKKLKKWIFDQRHKARRTQEQKHDWLYDVKRKDRTMHQVLTSSSDFITPSLYHLQTLYHTYLLEEEILSVGNALDRLELLESESRVSKYFQNPISDPSYLNFVMEKEIQFRVKFLEVAYFCLENKKLPENNSETELDELFNNFYADSVMWLLVQTIKEHPQLRDVFSQIPKESAFWEETQLNHDRWEHVVKTLNPRISVCTLSPIQLPSEQ